MAISGYECISCREMTDDPTRVEQTPTQAGESRDSWGPYCPPCGADKRRQLERDYHDLNYEREETHGIAKREADQKTDAFRDKWGKDPWG